VDLLVCLVVEVQGAAVGCDFQGGEERAAEAERDCDGGGEHGFERAAVSGDDGVLAALDQLLDEVCDGAGWWDLIEPDAGVAEVVVGLDVRGDLREAGRPSPGRACA
jgi:hypothetical protein